MSTPAPCPLLPASLVLLSHPTREFPIPAKLYGTQASHQALEKHKFKLLEYNQFAHFEMSFRY